MSIKRDNGWAAATRKQAVTAARNYFNWCRQEKLIQDNLAEVLKVPAVKLKPQRTISEAELEKLLATCDDSALGRRNAAIISLLFDSGIRSAELCRLRVEDVNLESREFFVRIKGGAVLPGWFGEETTKRLEDWLAVRMFWPDVKTLFVGIGGLTPGQPMTPDGLRRILRELGRRAGVSRVSAHAFRRGFAVAMSAAGIPDNILKDLGRWSTTQMIRRYTLAQQVRHLYRSPVDRTSTRNRDG